jgi:hypothetical protein
MEEANYFLPRSKLTKQQHWAIFCLTKIQKLQKRNCLAVVTFNMTD